MLLIKIQIKTRLEILLTNRLFRFKSQYDLKKDSLKLDILIYIFVLLINLKRAPRILTRHQCTLTSVRYATTA